MDTKSSAVISDVIAQLQGLLTGGASSASKLPKEASIPQFETNLAKCLEKAKAVSPQLTQLTETYTSASKIMRAILGFSKTCKKFSPEQEQKLKNKILEINKEIDAVEKKNAQYSEHCRAFRQAMQTALWVFVPTPQFLFRGSLQSADFWALKFMKKKNLDHNQWYKLFQTAVRSLQKYVVSEYPTGVNFRFNGDDQWGLLLDGKLPASSATQPAKQAPKAPVVQAQQPNVPVKKPKKKEMVGINLTIINYQNENIQLKSDEIQMKHGIFLQNSTGVHLKIQSKFKSLAISRCKDIVIEMKSCVSGVEIVNCKNVKLYVRERTPSVAVDTSESVNVILNEQDLECEIVSTKASQLTVAYTRGDGNETKAFLVSSQLVTKWDPTSQGFKTKVYDKFI